MAGHSSIEMHRLTTNEAQLRDFVRSARKRAGAGRSAMGSAAVGGRGSPAAVHFKEIAHPSYGTDGSMARSEVSKRRTRRRARWALKDALIRAHTAKGKHWSEFHELRVVVPAPA